MRIEALFWVSLCICAVSFLLFAGQIIARTIARPETSGGGAGGAVQQTLSPAEMAGQMRDLAQAFAKAGPIATSAVLCAFFGLIALISSGVVNISA